MEAQHESQPHPNRDQLPVHPYKRFFFKLPTMEELKEIILQFVSFFSSPSIRGLSSGFQCRHQLVGKLFTILDVLRGPLSRRAHRIFSSCQAFIN